MLHKPNTDLLISVLRTVVWLVARAFSAVCILCSRSGGDRLHAVGLQGSSALLAVVLHKRQRWQDASVQHKTDSTYTS